jgi:hypothetical protein
VFYGDRVNDPGGAVAVFVTASYGIDELPVDGGGSGAVLERASAKLFEGDLIEIGPPPTPERSFAARWPLVELQDAAEFWTCSRIPGVCDKAPVRDGAVFRATDPYVSSGVLDMQLVEGGVLPGQGEGNQYPPPLRFMVTPGSTGEESTVPWLLDAWPFEVFLFQSAASPSDALVCSVGYRDGPSARCDVAAPVTSTTASFTAWAPNPRRILDPTSTGPLRASLNLTGAVLEGLDAPKLTLTVQGAAGQTGEFTIGDTVTFTAEFSYPGTPLQAANLFLFVWDSNYGSALEGCDMYNLLQADSTGVATLTCTLSSAGAITASVQLGASIADWEGAPDVLRPYASVVFTGEGSAGSRILRCANKELWAMSTTRSSPLTLSGREQHGCDAASLPFPHSP